MDAPLMALKHLGIDFKVLAGSDSWGPAAKFWQHHHGKHAGGFYSDLTLRDHAEAVQRHGHPDLYVVGFPCPPFSRAGLHQGASVAEGQIIAHIIRFLKVALPACFILENVCGLLHQHAGTLRWILKSLRSLSNCIDYAIDMRRLNCKDHGIPHHRDRVWIVGFRKDRIQRPFCWPVAWGSIDLSHFLGPARKKPSLANNDLPSRPGARTNLIVALGGNR